MNRFVFRVGEKVRLKPTYEPLGLPADQVLTVARESFVAEGEDDFSVEVQDPAGKRHATNATYLIHHSRLKRPHAN